MVLLEFSERVTHGEFLFWLVLVLVSVYQLGVGEGP